MANNFGSLFSYLFRRRSRRGGVLYFLAAIPFLAFGLLGWEHGAFPFYAAFGIFIASQFFYYSFFGWIVVFGTYLTFTVLYTYLLVNDIFFGANKVLLDTDDSVVFIVVYIVISAFCVMLWRIRPNSRGELSDICGRPL